MRSSVRFEVSGLNQLKLLNTLLQKGICFYDTQKESQKLIYFSVNGKDKKKTIEVFEMFGYSYKVVNEVSNSKALKRLLPRLGLIIGMVVMIIVSAYASLFIWKIEIIGNDKIDDLSIIRFLKQNNIAVGNKKNFPASFVEEKLRQIDNISAVSAEFIGTTLKIDIIESAEITPAKQLGDLISLYDSEITRIVINAGTAKVKIGDRVSKGSMLIEGAEYNTAGEYLRKIDAQGTVYGKVNFTYSEIVSLYGDYKRTGNVETNTVIDIFGLKIGRNIETKEGYESETTVSQVGNLLPIYAITTKYYELKQEPDKELSIVEEEIKNKAINNLVICTGGSEIKTTVNSLIMSDKIYKIIVHIEAEVSIGGKSID